MKLIRPSLFVLLTVLSFAQTSPHYINGFFLSQYYREQVKTINYAPEVRIIINAPAPEKFNPALPTAIALFALPNGNTIEQTIGKVLKTGDDWHYDIQHIGAQTRFIRNMVTDYNFVTVYLESAQLSWPTWRSKYSNNATIIKAIVDSMKNTFAQYNPYIILTGHSGGGSFTFGYMNAVTSIPNEIKRIAFLDSDYNYDDATYGAKIKNWISASPDHFLSVLAYNDSVALYNGQPVVSPTGGTWYRSKMMAAYLSSTFPLTTTDDSVFMTFMGLNRRINFILKHNPTRAILHTVQVEKNGFIQTMVSGTPLEGQGYVYYGNRAYTSLIQTALPALLTIPPRAATARTGSQFMQDISSLAFQAREDAIYSEFSSGNVPDFMRTLKKLTAAFQDAGGSNHNVEYEVMPDYLCIGSNDDFCRVPMGPQTAQKIANLYGASMPTPKLVDHIYTNAVVKLAPVTYTPVGNQNEQVAKFIEHNTAIEQQRIAAGQPLGALVGGIKKDVVLSNLIIDPSRPNHVCIYGWHQLNGTPIQPLTNIHIDTYVDYSHGIRFMNKEFMLDGNVTNVKTVLMNSNLYKVLSNESAPMTQPSYFKDSTLPATPKSWGVLPVDSTSIRFVIKADSSIVSYKVYLSTNGTTFTDSASITPADPILRDLQKNTLYFLKIKALNSFGGSAASEVLACMPTAAPADVIIVNGFDRATTTNTYNFIRNIAPEIAAAGKRFASATNDAVVNDLFALNSYKLAAYILMEESTADETFSTAEQTKLSLYLRQGGKLLASGAEIAWDLDNKGATADKDFCYNFLKMKYIADAPNGAAGTVYTANSYAYPTGVLSGILYDNGTHGTINVQYPDVIKGVNGGKLFMSYQTVDTATGGAAVYYDGLFPSGSQPGKVVVIGFPFESIYTVSQRATLMQKLVQFFDAPSSISEKIDNAIPKSFALHQNYPNPFNPSTTFSYEIAETSMTRLKVVDILGKEIAVLVNELQSPGTYKVHFDGRNFASGSYFCVIEAGRFRAVTKMLLLK